MRTLKNVFLYGCDFLRVCLIKFPIDLVTTNRGRVVLMILIAMAIGLTGLHFWHSGSASIFIDAPRPVEEIIAANHLDHQLVLKKNKIDYYEARLYASPGEFVENLKPGEKILVSYYVEEFRQLGDGESRVYLVKTYQGSQQEIVYRVPCQGIASLSSFIRYSQDSLEIKANDHKDWAMLIWIAGGLVWGLSWLVVDVLNDG